MKILKNKTYNKLKQGEENFGLFLIAIRHKLHLLEKDGKAKFIINEAGSGISEWKLKNRHIEFNQFVYKFNGFHEWIVDEDRNADIKELTCNDIINLVYL
jgi:hypothetical protein